MFRPLRAVASIPEVRVIVDSVFNSFRMLFDVLLLFLWFIVLFGAVGVQLWKGLLRYRCMRGEEVFDAAQVCNSDTNPDTMAGYQVSARAPLPSLVR